MIPKIIHQTWKHEELPYPFQILANSWKEYNPEWSYQFWTDTMIRNFIKLEFPDFLKRFDSYPREIQRVDAFRYFLLKRYGGLYVDIDFECLCNIDSLLKDHSCVIGKEPLLHCRRFGKDFILCNAFMASAPSDGFINYMCEKVLNHSEITVSSPVDILNSTGPFILTEAYCEYKDKQSVHLLDPSVLYPITLFEKKYILKGIISEEMQQRIDKASAIHYFWGTW